MSVNNLSKVPQKTRHRTTPDAFSSATSMGGPRLKPNSGLAETHFPPWPLRSRLELRPALPSRHPQRDIGGWWSAVSGTREFKSGVGGRRSPALGILGPAPSEAWSPTPRSRAPEPAPVGQEASLSTLPTRGGWAEGSHGARSALPQREDPMGYGPDRTPSGLLERSKRTDARKPSVTLLPTVSCRGSCGRRPPGGGSRGRRSRRCRF